MAKPTYTKLKLTSTITPKELEWNDQKIEVKQYLSVQDKLQLISEVINNAGDGTAILNIGKVNVFFAIKVVEYYTNIVFTDKQKENPVKIYDEIIASGFYEAIMNLIPENELCGLYDWTFETGEQIYKYQNSIYGILDAISTDYEGLNLDIKNIAQHLDNKDGVRFLDEVLTKMG